jgi:hypothetical protein
MDSDHQLLGLSLHMRFHSMVIGGNSDWREWKDNYFNRLWLLPKYYVPWLGLLSVTLSHLAVKTSPLMHWSLKYTWWKFLLSCTEAWSTKIRNWSVWCFPLSRFHHDCRDIFVTYSWNNIFLTISELSKIIGAWWRQCTDMGISGFEKDLPKFVLGESVVRLLQVLSRCT